MEVDSTPSLETGPTTAKPDYMDEDQVMFNGVAPMDAENNANDAFYNVATLIDQLKHEDIRLRLNAMDNAAIIAEALGPERTRNEFLPYLHECIDDEDEVLLVMAEKLPQLANFIGGPDHAHHLLGPLENLAATEETTVRDKAVASLCQVVAILPQQHYEQYFVPLLKRLSTGEWFTSRTSATGLYAAAYTRSTNELKQELKGLFADLVRDESPMVRRSAAKSLGPFATQVSQDHLGTLLEMLQTLAQDPQDSVRLLTAGTLVVFGNVYSAEETQQHLLPIFQALAGDKSWRVRYMVASHYVEIANAFGENLTQQYFTEPFLSFLNDAEGEVRTAAISQITGYAKLVGKQVAVNKLLPCVRELVKDENQHARSALAKEVSGLASIVGQMATMEYLLPTFLQQLTDEFPDVRLNVISSLDEINKAIGVERLSQALLPAIVELSEDKQWRIRLAIIEYIPLLAKQFGPQFFEEKLLSLCMAWLQDKVFSIREAATANLKKLALVFGSEWAEETILHQIQQMASDGNYLHRITVLFALTTMADALPLETLRSIVLPTVIGLSSDPIPNIRFNVAKALESITPLLKHQQPEGSALITSHVKPTLEKLATDTDNDVCFFANRALQAV